jgi:5'-nucleotidase
VIIRRLLLIGVLLAAVFASSAEAKTRPLHVLVSNDDGVRAPGINALVQGLRKAPKVTVTVVAPATNKTGGSGQTTPGRLRAKRTRTRSGYPAVEVFGFPADSINYALRHVVKRSRVNLVITGINPGTNLGPFVDLSGTIGAARAAAQKGIPALATSLGSTSTTNFSDGVKETLAWLKANRNKLKRGTVMNLNVPGCSSGHPRAITRSVSTPAFPPGADPFPRVDCTQKTPAVRDEYTNLLHGFTTLTKLALKPATG